MRLKNSIEVGESIDIMKDGDVAVILAWPHNGSMIGEIVQRFRHELIVLGESSEHSYPRFFDESRSIVRIRIVNVGEEIIR